MFCLFAEFSWSCVKLQKFCPYSSGTFQPGGMEGGKKLALNTLTVVACFTRGWPYMCHVHLIAKQVKKLKKVKQLGHSCCSWILICNIYLWWILSCTEFLASTWIRVPATNQSVPKHLFWLAVGGKEAIAHPQHEQQQKNTTNNRNENKCNGGWGLVTDFWEGYWATGHGWGARGLRGLQGRFTGEKIFLAQESERFKLEIGKEH
jgi:hypothetical protein